MTGKIWGTPVITAYNRGHGYMVLTRRVQYTGWGNFNYKEDIIDAEGVTK